MNIRLLLLFAALWGGLLHAQYIQVSPVTNPRKMPVNPALLQAAPMQEKGLMDLYLDYSVANLDDDWYIWPLNSLYTIDDTIGFKNCFISATVKIDDFVTGYTGLADLPRKIAGTPQLYTTLTQAPYNPQWSLYIDSLFAFVNHKNSSGQFNKLTAQLIGQTAGSPNPGVVLWSSTDSTTGNFTDPQNLDVLAWNPQYTVPAGQRLAFNLRFEAPDTDTLQLAAGYVDGNGNGLCEAATDFKTSYGQLVYLPAVSNTANLVYQQNGLNYYFATQNWHLWYKVTYTDYTSVEETEAKGFGIEQNTPNPFSGQTTVKYHLQVNGDVYWHLTDVSGRTLRRQYLGYHTPGTYTLPFELQGLSAGIYVYGITVNGATVTKRMIIK
ncbi:MAG: T9SS type A sorting domain-containing protein [Flavobacteriales bacterium]